MLLLTLESLQRTPCGFCFVEFYTNAEALATMRYISGTKLDERIIRCDLDLGYRDGRQFGRGKSGGQVILYFRLLVLLVTEVWRVVYQVRDEHRQDYDPGRGGWGAQAQRLEIERRREVEARYADTEPGGPVAAGGEDWKDQNTAPASNLKRERSPDDDGNEGSRQVSVMFLSSMLIAHDDDSELEWAIH